MILAFSLGFVARHPGLLLVFIGVAGEVFFDWPEMKGKRAWGKRLSAIVLVFGLVLEFAEAAKSDKEVADTKERTALVESNNIVLQTKVEEIRKANNENEAKIRPRALQFDSNSMSSALKGKAKFQVEILYPKDDVEAFDLAEQILLGLGAQNGGWPVSMPRPIVEDDVPSSRRLNFTAGDPLLFKMGIPYGGFEIVTKNMPTNSMVGIEYELQNAISAGFAYGTYGDTFFSESTDSRLPDNFIRLVVGDAYTGIGWNNARKLR